MTDILLDAPLRWSDVAAIAAGRRRLVLSPAARDRIGRAHAIVRAIVAGGIRGYGVNTGVGALSDVIVPPADQSRLSHNILMSHAVGIGAPLSVVETRAIMVAAVNNFAHGYSGLRLAVVERLVDLLNAGCTPVVPAQGSVGYLSHMAHIGLAVIGHGLVTFEGERMPAARALDRLGMPALRLEAKEGLCLVNGTPCVTGLATLALQRMQRLMDWADAVAAMVFETQRCQLGGIATDPMALRVSPGIATVTASLSAWLAGSGILAAAAGRKTQDALSLRAVPHVHGAVREAWAEAAVSVDRELASVTDNPIVTGSPEHPEVHSQAHAVGARIGLAMDALAVAAAQLGMISERRLDRMVNPLVSNLPAFLAAASGVASGFMIAQYSAVSLVAENRRLAAPAGLDGGITSALQEDILCHATPAALKLLAILDNTRMIVAIEYLAACQGYDLLEGAGVPAALTAALWQGLRREISTYADDRPLGLDIERAGAIIADNDPRDLVLQVLGEGETPFASNA